jgi:hypothetical protein
MVYSEHGFDLSDFQKQNVAYAVINNTGITLKLNYSQLNGDFKIPLTNRQITRIGKKKNVKKGIVLKLSVNQLKQMRKSGGLLPLLALLPAIFGGIGAAGGIAGGVSAAVKASNERKAAERALEEQQRHNRIIEEATRKATGSGVFLKSGEGSGVFLNTGEGSGVFLKSGEGSKTAESPKVKLTANNLKKLLNQKNGNGFFLKR